MRTKMGAGPTFPPIGKTEVAPPLSLSLLERQGGSTMLPIHVEASTGGPPLRFVQRWGAGSSAITLVLLAQC
jgi:hypothetical protein